MSTKREFKCEGCGYNETQEENEEAAPAWYRKVSISITLCGWTHPRYDEPETGTGLVNASYGLCESCIDRIYRNVQVPEWNRDTIKGVESAPTKNIANGLTDASFRRAK